MTVADQSVTLWDSGRNFLNINKITDNQCFIKASQSHQSQRKQSALLI